MAEVQPAEVAANERKGVVVATLLLLGLGVVVCAFRPSAKRAVVIGVLVSPIPPIP